MSASVALLFGVHAHQPAGNFPQVLEDAHARCYRPFLETVYRYPQFRFALHFSGPLLDYLLRQHAADMALLARMVERGQVELFGAGDAEPVLAAIPNRDRLGQIARLSRKLAARFGRVPEGAWLTERVWEATVVPALVDCGIRYVTVDDYHFLASGRSVAELDGYFTTEEDGRRLDLFPISEALRYRIPFALAEESVAYLEGLAREPRPAAAIYFDDIEKFGIWPETYAWVYEKGWLREFVERVLGSGKITTQTFGEYRDRARARGIVYLPTTSYIEMNEWTLPAPAAHAYADLVEREKRAGSYGVSKAFLRGGIWKNFMSRYPEANWMHKRMLALSERLARLPSAERTEEMHALLYAAQANDAYWHGLFGGLYLPHLRRAVYAALLELERMLDRLDPRAASQCLDLDLDGIDELFLRNADLQAVVKLDGSAAIVELDAYALSQNFGDTLRRHAEHYHRRVLGGPAAVPQGGGIASAHDRLDLKHDISAADLEADAAARTLFRDAWVGAQGDLQPLLGYDLRRVDGASVTFGAARGDATLQKEIALCGNRVGVGYRYTGAFDAAGIAGFESTIDLAMPSCDGPGGRIIYHGAVAGGFGALLDLEGMTELVLDDGFMRGSLTLRSNLPVVLRARPCYTVSQSEGGFEKIMQSVTLTLSWPLDAAHANIDLSLEIRKHPA
ncbi:MAG: glycosyl hydrolase [Betaproteobacteria bacterium RIFCSPLOWO2_12_FULL_66_14]|nr:MAG: glycosyl hydrolase [Betaproteobacteria bacterium RIFCSPLOWO2_12_FULL_66_14]